MNFQHPRWVAFFISLAFMAVGCALFIFVTRDSDEFDLRGWISDTGIALVVLGFFGFIISLIWFVIARVILNSRLQDSEH